MTTNRVLIFLAVALVLLGLGYLDMARNDSRENAPPPDQRSAAAPIGAVPPTDAAVVVDSSVPPTIAYGLSFALSPEPAALPMVVQLHCHGEPVPLDRPHNGSCNPYTGDTSCSRSLPIACVKPTGARAPGNLQQGFYNGWINGQLGATQPVAGAMLKSEKIASARCEAELGRGWRMAEFHDGGGGWGLQGERATGIKPSTRYWVHINDQAGNCWNSPTPSAPAVAGADNTAAESARRPEHVVRSECAAKKKVLDERRPNFDTLSEQLRSAFTKLDAEYTAECEAAPAR